jgi:hypothetical protein
MAMMDVNTKSMMSGFLLRARCRAFASYDHSAWTAVPCSRSLVVW